MPLENNSYSDDIKKTLILYLSISDGILKGWGLILSTITIHASFIAPDYGIINDLMTDDQNISLMRNWIPIYFWGLSLLFAYFYIRNLYLKNINTNNLMTFVSPVLFTVIFLATGSISLGIIFYY